MNTPTRYCKNCGKPLDAQARFCGNCGQTVGAPPVAVAAPDVAPQPVAPPVAETFPVFEAPQVSSPSPQPPFPQWDEEILGVMAGAARKKGLLGLAADHFTLVFTNQRLIFAYQTSEMMKANVQKAKDAARQQGKGFFGQWGAVLTANSGSHYCGMQPAAILAEHPANYVLLYHQIRSAKLRESYDSEGGPDYVYLELETVSGKMNLQFNQLDVNQARQLLRTTLGNEARRN